MPYRKRKREMLDENVSRLRFFIWRKKVDSSATAMQMAAMNRTGVYKIAAVLCVTEQTDIL